MPVNKIQEDFQKIKKIFRSPALFQVYQWSKCVHGRIVLICILNVASVFCSLGLTLVTKGLIDAAVTSQTASLWKYGIFLLLLVISEEGLSFSVSLVRTKTSAKFSRRLRE